MPTILIVDDEIGIQLILQALFQRAGYETLLAADGKSGIELIQNRHPDLVILDDMLPDITGSDVCYKLKCDPLTQRTIIVMYSAGRRVQDRAHISAIRADAALAKPARPAELVKTVANLLATHH